MNHFCWQWYYERYKNNLNAHVQQRPFLFTSFFPNTSYKTRPLVSNYAIHNYAIHIALSKHSWGIMWKNWLWKIRRNNGMGDDDWEELLKSRKPLRSLIFINLKWVHPHSFCLLLNGDISFQASYQSYAVPLFSSAMTSHGSGATTSTAILTSARRRSSPRGLRWRVRTQKITSRKWSRKRS